MYERLMIVIVAAIFAYGSYLYLRKLQLRRAQNASIKKNNIHFKAGVQHIVYFWSQGCSQCKNAQKPMLDKLMGKIDKSNVDLIAICVDDNAELASLWGVRTLPTTYIIDEQSNVSHINNGLASEASLIRQLKVSMP